jgi:hypothetical protein
VQKSLDSRGYRAVDQSSDAVNALLIVGRTAAVKRSAVTSQMEYVFYVLYRTEATLRLR